MGKADQVAAYPHARPKVGCWRLVHSLGMARSQMVGTVSYFQLAEMLQKEAMGSALLVDLHRLVPFLWRGRGSSHPADPKAFRTYWVKTFPMTKGHCCLSNHISTFLSHCPWPAMVVYMRTRKASSQPLKRQGVGSQICFLETRPHLSLL